MIRYADNPAPAPIAPTLVERMAQKMREMGMGGVAVTADSLFEYSDFSRAEIEAHGREAADLARALSVRQLREAA